MCLHISFLTYEPCTCLSKDLFLLLWAWAVISKIYDQQKRTVSTITWDEIHSQLKWPEVYGNILFYPQPPALPDLSLALIISLRQSANTRKKHFILIITDIVKDFDSRFHAFKKRKANGSNIVWVVFPNLLTFIPCSSSLDAFSYFKFWLF